MRMTSDDFFSKNKDNFDLVFIDGLHTYAQVKKDILNSLKILNDGGLILLHDCLPRDYFAHAVPRSVIDWNGDVWKAYVEMRTKNNLDCYCCYADHGIGIIIKGNNSNILELNDNAFSKMKFNFFFQNYKNLMNLKEFEEIVKLI